MVTYREYTEVTEQTPFLASLAGAAFAFKSVDLYVTGEYALNTVMARPLPKSIEVKGVLSLGEMIALCELRGFDYTIHGSDVLKSADEKRFL